MMYFDKQRLTFRDFWLDYRSEVIFFLALLCVTLVSTFFGQFMPDEVFDNVYTPVCNTATVIASFSGAWILLRHAEGMRIRRFFAYALLVWGVSDLVYLIGWAVAPQQVMNMGAYELTSYELFIGNLLGWVLLLYPTEALRPGWMNMRHALWQLLPLVGLVALDYLLPINLWPVISLYPYVLLAFLFTHMRAYVKWCENNFSRLDNIDVRWIIRYCCMLFFVGINFVWMCSTHYHARGFTQQWFIVVMIIYSIEQILFRKDPWSSPLLSDNDSSDSASFPSEAPLSEHSPAMEEYKRILLDWIATNKPYVNPDFQLMDLRAVLPMNRTYLSHFIHESFGCSFYQFVNRYRIEEAKRLLREKPDITIEEVATRSGFSSRSSFTQSFTREIGISPREWSRQER